MAPDAIASAVESGIATRATVIPDPIFYNKSYLREFFSAVLVII